MEARRAQTSELSIVRPMMHPLPESGLLFSQPGFEMLFAEGGSPLDQPPAGPPNSDVFRRLLEKYDLELLEMTAH